MRLWHRFINFLQIKKLMYLRHHLISCIILTIILFPFYNYLALLIFIFGFLIDVDHYLYDVIKTKNLSLIKSYKLHMDKDLERKDQLHILHTLEFIIPFLLLTFFSRNIYLILLSYGLVLHLILDVIYRIHAIKNNIKLKQTRALSLIFWVNRNLRLVQ